MSRVCQVTGKRPITGNNVSHAKNRTRRRFLPNLHRHRFWVESEKRFVSLRVSAKGMRIIDKKGIDSVLTDVRSKLNFGFKLILFPDVKSKAEVVFIVGIGNAFGIFQTGVTAIPEGKLAAPLLVPVFPLLEESVIAV